MALSYVDLSRFRALSVLDSARVDDLEARRPGFVLAQCELRSRDVEDKLRLRYRIPFPERHSTIERWIVWLVNVEVAFAIGFDNIDTGVELLREAATKAETEIAAAANPAIPAINLPLVDRTDASAISKGGPRGYSESSPYTWISRQGRAR